jgi:general secretion pathway protein A
MYLAHYGLRELPFELTPDPKFLFATPGHGEALSNLEYGLSSAKPLTVLIGEAGTGKTTMLRTAFESERCRNVRCVFVSNPLLTRDEFVNTLATRFELKPQAAHSKAVFIDHLERLLRDRRANGVITALVVDEAQRLSIELLEEIRMLANIETTRQKLLPLVLAGQPELGVRLEDPLLRQLKQRVALRCEIAPFTMNETASYIAARVRTAGGVPSRLFTREAVLMIHDFSRGIPRTINVIADNALVNGMALGKSIVDSSAVQEVARDFALRRQGTRPEDDLIVEPVKTAVSKPDVVLESVEELGRTDERSDDPNPPALTMRRRFSVFGSRGSGKTSSGVVEN